MSDTLEYIDAYFNRELEASEQKQFEVRCTTDKEFAEEVAFYIAARGEARKALLLQKQEQWKSIDTAIENKKIKPVKKSIVLQWMPYAAAACVIFIMAFYFMFQTPVEQRLANQYLNENYSELSQTMDASKDSIQQGIASYNNKDYKHAADLFDGVRTKDNTNSDAKKYAGLSYLQMKNYDKALQCFEELSGMKDLAYNSGDLLQAVTLLQRNATGDKAEAKTLLQKVVKDNEAGSDKAKEMLNKW